MNNGLGRRRWAATGAVHCRSMKPRTLLTSSVILFLGLSLSSGAAQQPSGASIKVFEIELPELRVNRTAAADLVIPSAQVATIILHVLNPQAERIDYGQIHTYINGEASDTLGDKVPTETGKRITLDLKRRPGFELKPGRNTVEIQAENTLGRVFYSSFVLHTETENRNPDFRYDAQLAGDKLHRTPPELAMIEPEHAIIMPPSRASHSVRFVGLATAATSIQSVLVDGVPVPLKRGSDGQRKIGLAYEDNQVTFDAVHAVKTGTAGVKVEAVDSSGNRTELNIPVLAQGIAAPAFKGKKYALIIGISNFLNNGKGVQNLKYADRDARSVYDFLQSPAGGRFSPENVLLLLNEKATLGAVRGSLTSFVGKPGPDDLLLLFMATHGGPDPYNPQNLYFIFHDTDTDRMADTAMAMRDFETMVQQRVTAKRRVMLFDACHSAGLTGSGGEVARGGNNLMNLYLERLLYREEGRAVITSSDVSESSYEAERWGGGHGVFTHFLLDGLNGKADENLDGLVTVGELFRFVRQKVRIETRFRQNPRMVTGDGESLTLSAAGVRVAKVR